jgi:hypothetical protein
MACLIGILSIKIVGLVILQKGRQTHQTKASQRARIVHLAHMVLSDWLLGFR